LFCSPQIKNILFCTLSDYQIGWCKAHETTLSSPSRIHFGHYIAGTFDPEKLVINAKLVDIPLHTGFSPAHWHKGLNVMLEKTPGNYNVEKLRIMLLFEADFNYNSKWLGWAIMFNVEAARVMANEQYSSQKQKLAIAQCLNKLLFYNIIWFWQQPAALCLKNAKCCYDCIVLLVAALCLCCHGASQQSIPSMISTIHQMEHPIQTTYGDSSKSGSWKNGVPQWLALDKLMAQSPKFGQQ